MGVSMNPETFSHPGPPAEEGWTERRIRWVLGNPTAQCWQFENRYLIWRMLQAMYRRQTEDEQSENQTFFLNGVGFNGVDAPILSEIAEHSKPYRNLTVKQAALVGKRLQKYIGQLMAIAASEERQPYWTEDEGERNEY